MSEQPQVPADDDPEFSSLDCSAVIADVWLLLDNECDPDARARLKGHLDNCPSCLAHYGIESELKALINASAVAIGHRRVCGTGCGSRSASPSSSPRRATRPGTRSPEQVDPDGRLSNRMPHVGQSLSTSG